MNLRDLFIIYLACGAPFGVYYFLQNRNRTETKILWLKSLLRFVFWIPFAWQLVVRTSLLTNLYNHGFDKRSESDSKIESEIEDIKKIFEKNFAKNNFSLSIFEFRETFDRYVGLSAEVQNDAAEISSAETELFRITDHSNKKLAETCLNRRNRKRLSFHHKLARRDFFEICRMLFDSSPEFQPLLDRAIKLTALLEDSEARIMFENLAVEFSQTEEKQNVSTPENELWNSEKQKLLTEPKISTNLQVLTATANLSKKD